MVAVRKVKREKRRPVRVEQKRRKKSVDKHKSLVLRQIFVGLSLILFMSLVTVVIWYGSRLEIFTITDINVDGGETISHAEVQKIADQELMGEYYSIIPKRFAWFYPAEIILDKIKNLPRVKDVQIDLEGNNTLNVNLSEYYPFALWCDEAEADSLCMFLDADGYAFITAPAMNGSSMLRYYDPDTAVQEKFQAFTPNFLSLTSRLALLVVKDAGFSISYIEKVSNEEANLHLAGGGMIKVSTKQTVEDTFANLVSVLQVDEFKNIKPGNFQYIDLRFGNKVFINDEDTVSTTTPPLVEDILESDI